MILFSPIVVFGIHWHASRNVTGSATLARFGGRSSYRNDASGSRDDSGVIVVL